MASAQHLFLLKELVRRDFQSRYAGSFLGLFWPLAQPLWQLALFSFVFSTVLKVSPVGERTSSFAVFLFCGLLPWLAFHEGIQRSVTAITDNAALVKRLSFPPWLLVVAVVVAALLQEAIAAGVFLLVLAFNHGVAWGGMGWLLVALPLQVALTLGLGLVVAGLQVFLRDTLQLAGLLLSGWFYLTPVVYPLAYVPVGLRSWVELNPLTALVSLYRGAFLGGTVEPSAVAVLLVAAVSALGLGLWMFRRLQGAFADVV
jgi:lipopolysaccharide transport system permease protein